MCSCMAEVSPPESSSDQLFSTLRRLSPSVLNIWLAGSKAGWQGPRLNRSICQRTAGKAETSVPHSGWDCYWPTRLSYVGAVETRSNVLAVLTINIQSGHFWIMSDKHYPVVLQERTWGARSLAQRCEVCVCIYKHLEGVLNSHSAKVVQVGSLKIPEGAAVGEGEKTRGRVGRWCIRWGGSQAELCWAGMQIVSMCEEDRRAVLAPGRCG